MYKKFIKEEKGDFITFSIYFLIIFVFFILPLASIGIEKFIVNIKGQEIKDSIDVSNLAVYNSLNVQSISMANVAFDSGEARSIFTTLLATNLKLNPDLTPTSQSIAQGPVTIDEFIFYTSGLPTTCSQGKVITRPAIHTTITVPVKPILYTRIVLNLMGKEFIELKVHVDSNLPVNK